MKFSINPQKGDQIEFRESSVYYPELDLRFKSLPKDVQKYLEKECPMGAKPEVKTETKKEAA